MFSAEFHELFIASWIFRDVEMKNGWDASDTCARHPPHPNHQQHPDQGEWRRWWVTEGKWSSVVWNLLQSGFVRRSVSAALWNAKPEIPPQALLIWWRGGGRVSALDSC